MVDLERRREVARDHLLSGFAGAFGNLLEVGCKVRIVVAAGNGDVAAAALRRESVLDQVCNDGLEGGPRREKRIVSHHQGPHRRNRFHQAGKLPGCLSEADRGVQHDHPGVDLGRDFVGEFDGEGGVAAGKVPNVQTRRGRLLARR